MQTYQSCIMLLEKSFMRTLLLSTKVLFIVSVILTSKCLTLQAQSPDNERICSYCKCDVDKCGPWNQITKVKKVVGEATEQAPFNQVLHIETHHRYVVKGTTDYGTVSFINENTLVTARHVVGHKGWMNQIGLSLSTRGTDDWIYLNKGEFEITYFSDKKELATDLAIIKLLNKDKLGKLYKGHFSLDKIDAFEEADTANLTGYPCYFSNTPMKYDTLINRNITKQSLNLNQDTNFIAYQLFTCIGDSGAPVWVKKNNKYYIIAIHHGGSEDDKGVAYDSSYNIAVRLNKDMINWLKKIAPQNESQSNK